MSAWLNALGYQLVWLAAVWGASHGRWWLAPLALLPFALCCLIRRDGRLDGQLMILVALGGTAMDSIYAASGAVAYAAPVPSAQAAPFWIAAIWAAFALTLRHSFRFLHARPWIAAAFGGLGAPMAYLAAASGWHAVRFPHGTLAALLPLALCWAFALPAMLWLAVRVERPWMHAELVHEP